MKQSILVTGANGQLGKCLQDITVLYPAIDFHFFNSQELPVEDMLQATEILEAVKPGAVINAAAYTAVDKAEVEQERAFEVNGTAVKNLAALSKKLSAKFIHVSTDYVFDGHGTIPYKETDKVDPVNKYGESKLKGEQLAMQVNPESKIVRTSWVYSEHGNNFVKTMLRLMKERESIGVVNDQIGSPTYAVDLAEALITLAIADNNSAKGFYHFSNTGPISWFEFALAIKEISGSTCKVNPIPTESFPTLARRPHYSVLDNTRIATDFNIIQKPWRERLSVCLMKLKGRSNPT